MNNYLNIHVCMYECIKLWPNLLTFSIYIMRVMLQITTYQNNDAGPYFLQSNGSDSYYNFIFITCLCFVQHC